MSDTIELASTVLSVGISTQNLGRDLLATVKGLGGQVAGIGKTSGADYSKSFNAASKGATATALSEQGKLKAAVEASSKAATKARAAEGDAARKVQIEEQKLTELRERGNAKASQILTAEDRIEKARRNLALATDKATTEQRAFVQAQDDLQRELGQSAEKTETFGQKLKNIATGKVSIKGAFSKVGAEAADAGDDAGKKFSSKMHNGVKGGVGKLGDLLKTGLLAGVAAAGLSSIGSAVGDMIAEAREAEKVGKTTEQIIKATGGAAKVSSSHVGEFTASLSEKVGMDDELIQSGANLLLTFKNVRNEVGQGSNIFDRATASAVDLSAAGFGSVEDASKMLGKALNDPARGITALGRAGVTFSEDQKKAIKQMAATGDVLGAQKIILAEVESQVGGVAEANSTASERMQVAWGNFQESLGTRMLPMLDKIQDGIVKYALPAAEKLIDGIGGIWSILADGEFQGSEMTFGLEEDSWVIEVLFGIRDGFKGVGDYLATNPFGGVADTFSTIWGAVSEFSVGLGYSGDEVVAFGDQMTQAETNGANFRGGLERIAGAFTGWIDVVRPIALEVWDLLVTKWGEMQPTVSAIFESIQTIVRNVMDGIAGFVRGATAVIKMIWENWGPGILQIIGGLWTAVEGIFRGAFKILEGITDVFAGIFTGDTDKMMSGVGKIFEGGFIAIKGIFEGAVKVLGGVWDGIKNTFAGPVNWVINNVLNPLITKINQVAKGFGLPLNIPTVQPVATAASKTGGGSSKGNQLQFWSGGYTGPGGKYEPRGVVHAGEVVWSQADVAAWGGPLAVDRMRRERRVPGFAGGGIVPNAAQGFRGYDPGFLSAIKAWAALTGRMFYMTGNGGTRSRADQERAYALYLSGRGPLAARPGTSAHGRGLAMDINPWPSAREAALLGQFGLGRTVMPKEPWHIGSLRGGRGGGFGGSGGGFDPLAMIKAAVGSVLKVTGAGYLGDILNAIPGKLIDGAAAWISSKIDALNPTPSGASGADGGVRAMGRDAAAKRGWGMGAQWNALSWIIGKESGWRPTAQNPTSTAYGLFQFLNGTWASTGIAKTSNPALQAEAGMRYISARYGTPIGAQSFWQRNHWYDDGGWLPTGNTLAMNGTGSPEAILTAPQWRVADKAIEMAASEGTPLTAEQFEAILARLLAAGVATEITGADHMTGLMAGRILTALKAEV